MAPNRSMRHGLFSKWLAGNMVVADASERTGTHWYVDSGSATGADEGGSGLSPDAPFLTLDYAFGTNGATANNGDVIIVMPGHAETIASAGAITMDLAGVSVIGLGEGADRPTFTFSETDSTIIMSAASLRLENVVLVSSIDAVVSAIVISGADCVIKDVEVQDGSASIGFEATILTTAGAARLTIDGLKYRGFIAGNAATRVIALVGVVTAEIKNCNFWGEVSTGMINFETTLCTGITVDNCYFYEDGTGLANTVVDTVTSSIWQVSNCFSGKEAVAFSGGSAAALAGDDIGALTAAVAVIDEYHDVPAKDATENAQINEVLGNKTDTTAVGAVTETDSLVGYIKQIVAAEIVATAAGLALPKCVVKSDGAVLAAADDLFDISGGSVFCRIWGLVTTVFDGATNLRLQIDVIEPAATVELNAGAVACNTQAAGSFFYNVGVTSVFTPATGGAILMDPVTVEPTWFLLAPGTVTCLGDVARAGVIEWYMEYIPLSPSSLVVAAT